MSLMEIMNTEEVRVYFNRIDDTDRMSGAFTMLFFTTKLVIFFMVNVVMMFMFVYASWEVLKLNKQQKVFADRTALARSRNPTTNQIRTQIT